MFGVLCSSCGTCTIKHGGKCHHGLLPLPHSAEAGTMLELEGLARRLGLCGLKILDLRASRMGGVQGIHGQYADLGSPPGFWCA